MVLILALGFFLRPTGLDRGRVLSALKAFAPLCVLIALAAWLIHEQFSGAAELLGLSFSIAAAACLGYPFTAALSDRLLAGGSSRPNAAFGSGRIVAAGGLSFVLGLGLLVAASYLAVYAINQHYLTTFGM